MSVDYRSQFKRSLFMALALFFAVLVLSACSSSPERRSIGTVIDDQTSEIQILDILFARPEGV